MKLLEYYTDPEAKKPAPTDGAGNVKLQFPEIPIQGRTTKTTLYIRNNHSYPMELEPTTTDPDLTIAQYPQYIRPDQIAPVTFVFTPKEDRITPLSAKWDFGKTIYEELDSS